MIVKIVKKPYTDFSNNVLIFIILKPDKIKTHKENIHKIINSIRINNISRKINEINNKHQLLLKSLLLPNQLDSKR